MLGALPVSCFWVVKVPGSSPSFCSIIASGTLSSFPIWIVGRSPRRAATDNLVQLLSNRTSVVRVGTAYLVTAPEDADPNVAIDRMRRHGDALASALETGSPGQVRILAARDIREDLAEGRIVKVAGWLLSQTEARLCALALMLCSGSPWRHRAVGL